MVGVEMLGLLFEGQDCVLVVVGGVYVSDFLDELLFSLLFATITMIKMPAIIANNHKHPELLSLLLLIHSIFVRSVCIGK